MKCDELKAIESATAVIENVHLVYRKSEVDSAIDELKREHHNERDEYIDWVNRLQKENAELKEVYKDSVDVKVKIWERCKKAEDELRKTQRALWLARAERAKVESQHWIVIWRCDYINSRFFINKSRYKHTSKVDRMRYPWGWRDIWIEVEKRCIKKAEEYK